MTNLWAIILIAGRVAVIEVPSGWWHGLLLQAIRQPANYQLR